MSDRLFLHANVLFSAAYREDAGLRALWTELDATLLTSRYALEEARRNLGSREQRESLSDLAEDVELVSEADPDLLPNRVDLPPKDEPILASALAAGATHLVTGDVSHFGPLFGEEVAGVHVLRPADLLRGS